MTKINFAVPGFFVPVRGMGYISRISASYNNPRQVIVPERGIGYIGLMTLADIEPSTLQSLRGVQVASPAAVPVSSKVVLQSPRGVQVASGVRLGYISGCGVAVPVRGTGCIRLRSDYLIHHSAVAVPERGTGCISKRIQADCCFLAILYNLYTK